MVIKNIVTGAQSFLSGHSHPVTCIALSKCGRFIASGQTTEMGNKVSFSLCYFAYTVLLNG